MVKQTYQKSVKRPQGLEDWVVALVRVGAAGNAGGVRQLANRMARAVPEDAADPAGFREAVGQALADAASRSSLSSSPLRRAEASGIPKDDESALPLAQLYLEPDGDEPVLDPEVRSVLDEVLLERARADDLSAVKLRPSRTVLLTGPPGVGKTMTATFTAHRLGLPLLTIDLASVMSSYLGRTGRNLRAALEYARGHDTVVFIDEFDALAKRRDDASDIGELKRLVNILLLELERWPQHSMLLAATNHPQLLDTAVERRFDRVLRLGLPDREQRRQIFDNAWPFDGLDARLTGIAADLLEDATGFEVSAVATQSAKRVVLQDVTPVEALAAELSRLRVSPGPVRDQLIRALHEQLNASNREIARLVGVSHPTVAAALKRTGESRHG